MSIFIEDDPNFYRRNSIFEEDCLDNEEYDDNNEIEPLWWKEPPKDEEERIRAYEEHRIKSEQEDEEYREYCETMNRLDAVFYGEEDYM